MASPYPSLDDRLLKALLEHVRNPVVREMLTWAYGKLAQCGLDGLPGALGVLMACLIHIVAEAVAKPKAAPAPESRFFYVALASSGLLILVIGTLLGWYGHAYVHSPTTDEVNQIAVLKTLHDQHIKFNGHTNLDNSVFITIVADRKYIRAYPYPIATEDPVGETIYWPPPVQK